MRKRQIVDMVPSQRIIEEKKRLDEREVLLN